MVIYLKNIIAYHNYASTWYSIDIRKDTDFIYADLQFYAFPK